MAIHREKPKLTHAQQIARKVADVKPKDNNAICFTNGCFDGFHAGHLNVLRTCVGTPINSTIVVGVDSDERYEEIRGYPPKFPAEARVEVVRVALRGMWHAVKGYNNCSIYVFPMEEPPAEYLKALQPTYYAKGMDVVNTDNKDQLIQDLLAMSMFGCQFLPVTVRMDEGGKLSSSRLKQEREKQ